MVKNRLKNRLKENSLKLEKLVSPLWLTEWGKRIGLGVIGMMSISLLTTGILLPIQWIDDIKLVRLPVTNGKYTGLSDTQPNKLIEQIPNWHLFGATPLRSREGIPVTSLPLHLIGIMNAASESESRVIISQSGQTGKVYQLGDDLVGARITAIERDQVLLDNGGELEKLPLGRAPLLFQPMPKTILPEE